MSGTTGSRHGREKRRREGGVRERLYGRHVIEEALRAGRRELHRLWVRSGPLGPEWRAVLELGRRQGLVVEPCDAQKWNSLAGSDEEARQQRCLLEAGPLPVLEDVRKLREECGSHPGGVLVVALDGVEDPQNVGTLARVADAAGAHALLLTNRRSPPLSPALSRASAGAIEWQCVARIPNLVRGLKDLKEGGFWVLAADPDADQVLFDLPDALLAGDLVVVLGAEGRGLRPGVRAQVDHLVSLPMQGRVASLNVATAGAVILYERMRRARISVDP